MKIIELLPELDIGGVERHVIDLTSELALRGHELLVISAGGKMAHQLSPQVRQLTLPVHRKNPITGWLCACRIASLAKAEGWQLLHAHSRVPAWIAMWAAAKAGIPYIVTAHVDFGNKSPWIYRPYRNAAKTICVSAAVQEAMKSCFFDNTQVVLNGLDEPSEHWIPENARLKPAKLLFVGRLSPVKGLQNLLKALPEDESWTLEVLGDGPMRAELEELTEKLGLAEKVTFHGYSEEVDHYMAAASCLLFPSYTEGMPLTLARAVQIGLPVIASDIGPVSEMLGGREGLLAPEDISGWRKAIKSFLETGAVKSHFPAEAVPSLASMAETVEQLYSGALKKK